MLCARFARDLDSTQGLMVNLALVDSQTFHSSESRERHNNAKDLQWFRTPQPFHLQ